LQGIFLKVREFLFVAWLRRLFRLTMHINMSIYVQGEFMRTTLDLNEELLEKARNITKIKENTALIHEALRALIARSAQKEFASLGGIQKNLKSVSRRKAV